MYKIAVEGLQPGDTFKGSWGSRYKVLSNDHTGNRKINIVTLEVENFFDKIITKKYKLNTMVSIIDGPTFHWKVKMELRRIRRGDYCKHCGEDFD